MPNPKCLPFVAADIGRLCLRTSWETFWLLQRCLHWLRYYRDGRQASFVNKWLIWQEETQHNTNQPTTEDIMELLKHENQNWNQNYNVLLLSTQFPASKSNYLESCKINDALVYGQFCEPDQEFGVERLYSRKESYILVFVRSWFAYKWNGKNPI